MIYLGQRKQVTGWRAGVMRTVVITLAVLTLWGSAGARVLLECPLHEDTAADPAAHATSDHAASDQAAEPAEHGGSPASEHEDHDCQCGYELLPVRRGCPGGSGI